MSPGERGWCDRDGERASCRRSATISTPDGSDAPSSPRIATTRIGSPGNGFVASSLASTSTVVVWPRGGDRGVGAGLSSGRVDGTTGAGCARAGPRQTVPNAERDRGGRPFAHVLLGRERELLPASESVKPSGSRLEHRVHELAEVVRVRVVGEPDEVDAPSPAPARTRCTAPMNVGGWFSRGRTVIGSTMIAVRPSGSVALGRR